MGKSCKSAAAWRRANASIPANQCVEVRHGGEAVGVRDSKGDLDVTLAFSQRSWDQFLGRWRHEE